VSTRHPTDRRPQQGDGSPSRPSQTNRQAHAEHAETAESGVEAEDLCGATGRRPLTVDGRSLRPEAVVVETPEGFIVPADGPSELPEGERKARPWYRVVREWRDWYEGYEQTHITFERDDGKIARTKLENSYQPGYANRYYAKLKDFEREVEREYEGLSTVMLTFSASTLNDEGNPRCPADHMREIADGWDVARKQLYHALDGYEWEYAKVWEPTSETGKGPAGYGHLHVAVFVEAGPREIPEIGAERFGPVMDSYVEEVEAAHPAAHAPEGGSVSVNHEVNNVGSYVSEYIGGYGERAVERPMHEQQFYAVAWATGTQRVTFSNGANEMIREAEERRERREETDTRASDRGGESGGEGDESGHEWLAETEPVEHEWDVKRLCSVPSRRPQFSDPTTGGVETVETAVRSGVDPPRSV
jgi:hypothetical protein